MDYCAHLKAIGVNLFRAARVKRALDAPKPAPGTAFSGVGSTVFAVKKLFLGQWRQLRNIVNPAIENALYAFCIAA